MGNVSALNVSLSYPDKVEINQEFEVAISLNDFEDGDYAVKLDIINGDEKRISKIYDENLSDWKSSYYYVKDVVASGETEGIVKMIVYEYGENSVINVKVKDSKGAVKTFNGNSNGWTVFINNPEDKLSDLKSLDGNNKTSEKTRVRQTEEETIVLSSPTADLVSENNASDIAKLESKSIKSNLYMSNQEKVKQYCVYLFFVFLLLIIVFFILRRSLRKRIEIV